ncbi:Ribonuclease P protein component [Hyella patelloides LEGE 07179]|uniref:Ribonuclease P protein component n=1 Tax=Hyella patelloides LEGE 07179 TaxID=945734 RepID=A0A563VL17_9CYAN|nr:ribonuclease P protein component [Hyella patelloides]VEP12037.1 Ribonuclease P protein component [Hyella patelloides LEGE 07179]
MGLPSIHRLKHWREFRAVYQKGMRRYGSCLILRALLISKTVAQSHNSPTRIGISISTKVSKKAVQRNLIKRRIRSAFQELLPRIDSGWYIVIVVKNQAIECKYGDFLRELEQLLIESNIINGY